MASTRLLHLIQLLSLFFLASALPSEYESSLDARGAAVKKFTITLTWEATDVVGAAQPRDMILMNGTLPGPALHLNVGDNVQFLVHNKLPFGTSVHFHGIEQKGTPWSDGVPGLSQKPIAPGASFLYEWQANAYGTYFYHAHRKGQIMDGLYGPILVQPKANEPRPFSWISNSTTDQTAMKKAEANAHPIILSDFSQFTSAEFYDISIAGNIDETCVDSLLVNGKGSVYCQTQDEINALTNPQVTGLLSSAGKNPPFLTLKGCLPPDVALFEGNYTFNDAAIPPEAFDVCTPSSGPMEMITVDQSNGWASLNFIAAGGLSTLEVSIDSHPMWIYQVEGTYIEPIQVGALTIYNGERYSVMIQLNQEVGQYAIRVANNAFNQVISGFGVLSYKGATGPSDTATSYIDYAGVNTSASVVEFDVGILAPWTALPLPQTPDITHFFNISKLPGGAYEWQLANGEAYNMSQEMDQPILFNKNAPRAQDGNLFIQTKMGDVVDLIVQVAGPLAETHPMHKHSNKAWFIGTGTGSFPGANVAEAAAAQPEAFNLNNPMYRDGFATTPAVGNASWAAIRYKVENPGAFLFHCHQQTHLSGGMAVATLDGVDQWPTVPKVYLNGNNGIGKRSLTDIMTEILRI